MGGLGIFAIIVLIIIMLAIIFRGENPNHGLGGGSKKGKFGVVGLVVALFGILGLSNYLQRVM